MAELEAEEWLFFFSAKQARRPAVIRQILTKRLSNSALFWGMCYQILDYINVFPQLDTVHFDRQIDILCKKKYLNRNNNGTVILTELGLTKKDVLKKRQTLTCPELFNVYRIPDLVWMIRLLVQVASEASWGNSRYYVAVDNFECQVVIKKWLKQYSMNFLQENLLKELANFLQQEKPLTAWIFCSQFAGHNTVPATTEQLAKQSGLSQLEIETIFLDLSSRFALHLIKVRSPLCSIIEHFKIKNSLFDKSRAALKQALNGVSIADMAQQTQLKESTICEHLLNAAIIERNFPYSLFLNSTEEKQLTDLLPSDIDQWQYKLVGPFQDQISFFKYRLFAIKRSHKTIEYK